MTEERVWARKCIRGGFSVLAAIVGAFIGLVIARWLGVVAVSFELPSWLVWTFAVPMGVVVFWFLVLCLCLLWAHMRGPR